jgi:methylphosphotriester-DNA--protein-cysteine methyltransferase
MPPTTTCTLIGPDGNRYTSVEKGRFGGHRGTKIFGRLDCGAALRAIARGGYIRYRVFFADAASATKAGYRPCAVCMPDAYRLWKDRPPIVQGGGASSVGPVIPSLRRARS